LLRWELACSGGMKFGEPSIWPVKVKLSMYGVPASAGSFEFRLSPAGRLTA